MTSIENIIWAVVWFLILGGVFGFLLAIFSKLFYVKKAPKVDEIAELLPSANCGGCGYSGCAALAEAIAEGKAKPNSCRATSNENILKISRIIGVANEENVRYTAHVMCSGSSNKTKRKFIYDGIETCIAASKIAGGDKMCSFGCLGFGTCVSACKFDAIHIINGVSVVDPEKCRACGMCVSSCPKNLIELIPYDSKHWVSCKSTENGAQTVKYCDVGCIGCKKCEKVCKTNAIKVENNIAKIDYSLCKNCGECLNVCPRKIIKTSQFQKKEYVILDNFPIQSK